MHHYTGKTCSHQVNPSSRQYALAPKQVAVSCYRFPCQREPPMPSLYAANLCMHWFARHVILFVPCQCFKRPWPVRPATVDCQS